MNSVPVTSMPIAGVQGTTTPIKSIILHFWTCFFLDSEDGRYPTRFSDVEISCRAQGRFFTGPDFGPAMCIMILVLVYIIGLFGFVTNVLNVIVLRRSLKGASLSMKRLLIMLAVLELFACMFSIVFSTIIVVIEENVNRSQEIFVALKTFNVLFGFSRSCSIYITILVTIERYLVVAFPLQSKNWLSPVKSKIYLAIVIFLGAAVDIPWILNATVTQNPYASMAPNTTLTQFPYITSTTPFGAKVYPKMRVTLLLINFVLPFPLLLLFNLLLYKSIHTWNKSRQGLTRTQRKEISAAKMFSIVVFVLLACHSVSCVMFFSSQYFQVIHRESVLLQNLSTTISAAVNFLVYFGFGKAFRAEFKRFAYSNWARVTGQAVPDMTGVGTQSSKEGESSLVIPPDSNNGASAPESRNGATAEGKSTCCAM